MTRFRTPVLIAATLAVAATVSARPGQAQNLMDFAARNLTDLQATARVVSSNQQELGKIGRDFGNAYRLRTATFYYKEPGRVRIEGSIPAIGSAAYITTQTEKLTVVPRLRVRKTKNIVDHPSQGQSLMEIGMIAPSLNNTMVGTYLGPERAAGGATLQRFRLNYRRDMKGTHYIVSIDPKTNTIVRRRWIGSNGQPKGEFRYLNPTQIAPGIWMPTRVEVYNAEGKLGAVTGYSGIKVNTGLSDSLFQIS